MVLRSPEMPPRSKESLSFSRTTKLWAVTTSNRTSSRVPFLDHELVEYSLGLPAAEKQRYRGGKGLLVEACRDLLPPIVYERQKTGFALPMRAWMKGPLAPFVDQGLREIVSRQLLPQPFVAQLREQFERERLHWTRLWSVVVLAHFVRCNQPVPHPDENLALHPLA